MLNTDTSGGKIVRTVTRKVTNGAANRIFEVDLKQMTSPEVDLEVLREVGFVCAKHDDERHESREGRLGAVMLEGKELVSDL
jgi:hypothetical protein